MTDSQLDAEIKNPDLVNLSVHFDNVESYLVNLGQTLSSQTDIKVLAFGRGTQTAMSEALRLLRKPNTHNATYRALLEMLVHLRKGEVAFEVCTYLNSSVTK